MINVAIRHKVESFEKWLPAFEAHAQTRRAFGCGEEVVYRPVHDSGDVLVVSAWETKEGFDRFVAESDLKATMQAAGVTSTPDITVLGEAYTAGQ